MKAQAPKIASNKQSLAVKESGTDKPVTYKDYNGQEVSLSRFIINRYLAPNEEFTEEECWGLIGLSKARGLNPVAKDVYFQRYNGVPQIIVSRDYYEKRANMNPNYAGKKNGIAVINRKDEIEYREGTIMLEGESLLGGWCRVYMRNLEYPVFVSVQFEEAAKRKKEGELQATWASMPKTMIEKVAVVRALRQAMTEIFGGTYSAEELGFDEATLESQVTDIPENPKPEDPPKKEDAKVQDAVFEEFEEASQGAANPLYDNDEDEFQAMQNSFFN